MRVGINKESGEKVAVKIYEKHKLLEPQRRKSVRREIKIMERIRHEHIARLVEAFDTSK